MGMSVSMLKQQVPSLNKNLFLTSEGLGSLLHTWACTSKNLKVVVVIEYDQLLSKRKRSGKHPSASV